MQDRRVVLHLTAKAVVGGDHASAVRRLHIMTDFSKTGLFPDEDSEGTKPSPALKFSLVENVPRVSLLHSEDFSFHACC